MCTPAQEQLAQQGCPCHSIGLCSAGSQQLRCQDCCVQSQSSNKSAIIRNWSAAIWLACTGSPRIGSSTYQQQRVFCMEASTHLSTKLVLSPCGISH
jgi:hypothetical protein